jgi:L-iditol 2-dehydrogenase
MAHTSCRAAFYTPQHDVEIRTVDLPPPGPGEVRLRLLRSGVCGSDLHVLAGRWEGGEASPGHEFSGAVVALGPDVPGIEPGLRACVEPLVYCRRCRLCATGRDNLCENGAFVSIQSHGGFAEETNVPAYTLHPLGERVSDEQGALVEPLAVGLHSARLARVACGEDVLVLGGGTIGLMALQAARALGAGRVFVSAKHPHQQQAALDLGAACVVPIEHDALLADLRSRLPLGVDVVIDSVGSAGNALDTALAAVRRGGRLALLGGYYRPTTADLGAVVFKEVTIVGSNCYGITGRLRDFELALDLIRAGRVNVERLVTHRYPLGRINEAFRVAADKSTEAIKVHLLFD